MIKHQQLEVLALDKNENGKEYILTTGYNGHEFNHSIEIVDRNGVFGMTMPDELTCILRNEYTPSESQDFITRVKEKYLDTLS